MGPDGAGDTSEGGCCALPLPPEEILKPVDDVGGGGGFVVWYDVFSNRLHDEYVFRRIGLVFAAAIINMNSYDDYYILAVYFVVRPVLKRYTKINGTIVTAYT